MVDGARYLLWPELGECCRCCGDAGGCGPLRPDWTAGAVYEGPADVGGRAALKWRIDGLQSNYYYADARDGRPLALEQGSIDAQVTLARMRVGTAAD